MNGEPEKHNRGSTGSAAHRQHGSRAVASPFAPLALSHAPDGSRHVGREACLRLWQGIASDRSNRFELEGTEVYGERAIIRWRYSWGHSCGQWVRGANLMRVRDGLIIEGLGYVKTPKPTSEGELAARAYDMFAARKSCREVAIELRQPARVVLAWHRDFVALDQADIDLPADVLAKLRRTGLRLPQRQSARALPAAIQQMCEEFMERIEQLDPDAADARKAWDAKSQPQRAGSPGKTRPSPIRLSFALSRSNDTSSLTPVSTRKVHIHSVTQF